MVTFDRDIPLLLQSLIVNISITENKPLRL
jgi:hypothetical protein